MPISLFNPFETLHFNNETCFLTGKDLQSAEESISVFPEWLIERFSLKEKKFKMLDQVTGICYEELKLPCSDEVKNAFNDLEKEIQAAFTSGYEEIRKIPEHRLFLWIGKIVYGVLYNDLIIEMRRPQKKEKGFNMSPSLRKRFGKFHLMLQSLMVPLEFKGIKPWSLCIVKLKYSKDIFNYKDEPIRLNFSLGMNGFGIIACLQDNGAVGNMQQDMIQKISEKILHPIQFEELCARFQYTNYLLKKNPQHIIRQEDEKIIIESVPLAETPGDPIFGHWDDNMFAQVLAGYWEPWGFTKKEIITLPDAPISFLENDYTHEFIEPESVTLPF
jgi:hypothetical protein